MKTLQGKWLAPALLALAAGGCNLVFGLTHHDLAQVDAGAGGGTTTASSITGGSSCLDGMKNGAETDKDCGGEACDPCQNGEGCTAGSDCESKVCVGEICAIPACNDEQTNGAETDVDCGGRAMSGCPACANGATCKIGDDCASGVCAVTKCMKANVWGDHFEGVSSTSVTADSTGRISLAGNITGTTDFGGGSMTNTGGLFGDLFVARFDTAGKYLWAKQFAGTKSQFGRVSSDGNDNTVLAGTFSGSLQIGVGLTAAGTSDIFLAKLDLFGKTLWASRFGAAGGGLAANAVTNDSGQRIIIAGTLSGAVNLGDGPLTSAGGHDVLVAKFEDDGTHLWSKSFGGTGEQTANAVATDQQKDVIFTGTLSGSTNFGGGSLDAQGVADVFVTKLDQLGNHVWSKRFGDAEEQHGSGIAVDGSDNIIVVGPFQGTIDFGGAPLAGGAGKHIFVVKLDAGGKLVWSKQFDDSIYIDVTAVALDSLGDVIGTGQFGSQVDFGGGAIKSISSAKNIFVFKLDGTGKHLWSAGFGDTSKGDSGGLAISGSNDKSFIVAGYFGGTIDLGSGPITSLGTFSAFLAKYLTP